MSYIFVSFQKITFRLGNFANFTTFFSLVSTDFPLLFMSKVEKTVEGSILK